ncbi:MAG: catalase [Herbaspirillum sp.]|jgi:hypothetical protein|nr:catalase [Herbaspirillum sp.]
MPQVTVQAPYVSALRYRPNPFDVTKVRPHTDYPLLLVGTMTLNLNRENLFAQRGWIGDYSNRYWPRRTNHPHFCWRSEDAGGLPHVRKLMPNLAKILPAM